MGKINKWSKGYCCFCGYEGQVYSFQTRNTLQTEEGKPFIHSHCRVCYETLAGNACQYPGQYKTSLMKLFVQLTHMIMEELKNFKEKGGE